MIQFFGNHTQCFQSPFLQTFLSRIKVKLTPIITLGDVLFNEIDIAMATINRKPRNRSNLDFAQSRLQSELDSTQSYYRYLSGMRDERFGKIYQAVFKIFAKASKIESYPKNILFLVCNWRHRRHVGWAFTKCHPWPPGSLKSLGNGCKPAIQYISFNKY